jgi:hypothetical protein
LRANIYVKTKLSYTEARGRKHGRRHTHTHTDTHKHVLREKSIYEIRLQACQKENSKIKHNLPKKFKWYEMLQQRGIEQYKLTRRRNRYYQYFCSFV